MPAYPLLSLGLLALVLSAAAHDLAARRIPNRLLLVFLVLRCCGPDWGGALLGAAAGLLILLPLYLLGGMAAGDVKLMATVGAYTGTALLLPVLLSSALCGGLLALLMLARRGQLRLFLLRAAGMPLQLERGTTMPYAVAICAGTLVQLFYNV